MHLNSNIPLIIIESHQSKVCQRTKFIKCTMMKNGLWDVIS